jgi:hypothetical protein
MGSLCLKLLPEGRQVGVVDAKTVEFHLGDCRQTAPL